jgi:hypothetical protein
MSDNNYIVLRQGDDSEFFGREIIINLESGQNMTGWTAEFKLGDIVKSFSNFATTKKLDVVLSKTETASLPVGKLYGYIKITDENGKVGTLDAIPFNVLAKVF